MPLLFLIAGLILIVTVIRGTVGSFASRLSDDVSGGFLTWLAAILVVGLLGYVPALKTPSRYLIALVALVILLTRGGGFIQAFIAQVSDPNRVATAAGTPGGNPNLPAIPVQTSGGGGGAPAGAAGGGGGGGASPVSNLLQIGAAIVPFL